MIIRGARDDIATFLKSYVCLFYSTLLQSHGKVKSNKAVRVHAIKAYGGAAVQQHLFLMSELDRIECSALRSGSFTRAAH